MWRPLSLSLLLCTVFPAAESSSPGEAEGVATSAPEATDAFAKTAYWDQLYAAEPKLRVGPLMHSWQGVDFKVLQTSLEPLLEGGSVRALVIGCGDSSLPQELVENGAANVTGVDFSADVVASMAARSKEAHPGILWVTGDAAEVDLAAGAYDLAVDVGTLDAILLGAEGWAEKVLAQAHKALRPNGTFISVSTEAAPFRKDLFDKQPFPGGWSTHVEALPRTRSLDPRIVDLDPDYTVGSLSVYINRAVDAEADRRRAVELQELEQAEAARAEQPAEAQAAALDTPEKVSPEEASVVSSGGAAAEAEADAPAAAASTEVCEAGSDAECRQPAS